MKPFLLKNTDQQHEHRLFLERWHAEKRGRRVYFSDILHDLMLKEVRRIRAAEAAAAG